MKFLCWNLLVLKDTRTTVKSDYVISLNQNRLRNAVYLCINLSNSYLSIYRNKEKVILNGHSGYLMRTKVSSSNEGGVAAGFAVLDSIYLV